MNINNQHFMKPSGVPTAGRLPTTDSRHPGDFRHPTTDGPEVGGRMSEVEKDSRKSDVGCRMSRPMKPSGVPWLGDIPAGWDAVCFKTIIAQNDGGIWGDDLYHGTGTLVLRSTEQTIDGKWTIANPAQRDLSSVNNLDYYLLKIGDLVITKSSGSPAHIGKTSIVDSSIESMNCCYSNFMQRIRLNTTAYPKFYWHVLNSTLTREQFVYLQNSTSGIGNINKSDIQKLIVPFPPLPEQRAIADFLDEKCAGIDAIVEEAKSGIEEYAKWKQSVVFQAVTKGIPEGERHPTSDHRLPGDSRLSTSDGPDVESRMSDVEKGSRKSDVGRRKSRPMKDSGVEWIGEIPEEWEVMPIKHIVNLLAGFAFKSEEFEMSGSIRLLRGINVGVNGLRWNECVFWNKPVGEELVGYEIHKGDLIVGLDRPWISEGTRVCFATDDDLPCLLVQRVCRIRSLGKKDLRIIKHWLASNAFEQALSCETTGVSVPHISPRQILEFRIAIPPLPEQRSIAAYLDEKCSAIDALIEEKKQLIEDLDAYKKSLIYETVTGKRRPTADSRLPGDSRLPTPDSPKVGSRMSDVEYSRKSEVGSRKSIVPGSRRSNHHCLKGP